MKHGVISVGTDGLPTDLGVAMSALRRGQKMFDSPFFAPEFIQIVANVRDDLQLFTGESSKGFAYYCPLHVSKSGFARGVGGPFSDRNGVVSAPDFGLGIADVCELNDLYGFTTCGYVGKSQSSMISLKQVLNNETHLDDGFEAFLETQRQLYPSQFKKLRRLRRKLDKDFTDVEFHFDDRRETTFDDLIKMKRDQYARSGRHDVLRPEWVQNMLGHLRQQNEDPLRLRIASLFLDGELVAGELNIQSYESLHGWIVAFDTRFGKYSPGNLLTLFILEHMPKFGMEFYDSGIGGDHYKKYISNVQTPLGSGTIYAENSNLNPKRILRSAWSFTESAAPEKLASVLKRTRRRSEQILATEVDNLSRVRGYFNALNVEI